MSSRPAATLFPLAIGAFLAALSQADAATFEAKSPSLSDVSAAVASAKDGDSVRVPAGTATWTSTLIISNNITLEGAGAERTMIVDEVPRALGKKAPNNPKPPSLGKEPPFRGNAKMGGTRAGIGFGRALSAGRQGCLLFILLEKNLPFRMTGFTFRGGSETTGKSFNGEIRIRGNSHSFRIDHCTLDQLHGTELAINGFLWGVIDHCRFNTTGVHPITINHDNWNGGIHGANSWADEPYWGSERFVFIEDNVFENTTGTKTGIDAFEGSRFVVRHNRFHNCGVGGHGTEAQGRGTKQIEEYNNEYRNDRMPSAAGMIRSGSIITHDNTWTNVDKGHVLQTYRQFHRSAHWGISNGQNPYDDNAPNGTTGYWETGKHTGPNGSPVLIDATKHWATNQWHVPGVTYIIRNTSREAVNALADNQSFAISNTADSITCSAKTFTNSVLTFNTGDTYQIWKVNHSLDQAGLGTGDLLTGLPGLPAKWPNQVTEPCYSWNNTQDGKALNLVSSEPSIKEGRDFFNGMAKPGYKPYIYPHPLTRGTP